MIYKNFTLDDFQIQAIESVNKNNSVVVSAATGTGKTLIADYIIDKFLKSGKKVVYTAPIKALSNQKYRDFRSEYGDDVIGIMTGDVVINSSAPILVMTTEIYRNMLLTRDEMIMDVSYVIFDEIHYINDIERGTVWEESIIFSPNHVRFLCLSATIPNAREFADWINSIKKHDVDVVSYDKRAVPLKHMVFEKGFGLTTSEQIKDMMSIPDYDNVFPGKKRRNGFDKKEKKQAASHLDLIDVIRKDKLPAIYFVFSRKDCEEKAHELARRYDFAGNNKIEIINYVNSKLTKEIAAMESVRRMKSVLLRGIAYHHAGILPVLKEIVEVLFGKGLIKVLYATETFAVGINMPAKTVCFDSFRKFDGVTFRPLKSKEYFQLAGRAGRRGIDEVGYAIVRLDINDCDIGKIMSVTSGDIEPIISQFKLSFNTVLNLVYNHTDAEIKEILKTNFDYFLRKQSNMQVRIMASYNHKLDVLTKSGYISNGYLTEKGLFARHIYFEEILISEIFATKLYQSFDATELNILIAAIIYEGRRNDYFSVKNTQKTYSEMLKKLSQNNVAAKNINKKSLQRMIRLIGRWSNGCKFEEMLNVTNLQEGDLIRLFRRMIDVMRQIRRASQDFELDENIAESMRRIDRDLVAVEF